MKIKWKDSVVICATSFTILVLVSAVLNIHGILSMSGWFVLKLFTITAVIAVLMKITGNIPVKSLLSGMLIQFADVVSVVYIVGGILGTFPWESDIIWLVAGMLTITYFGTFGVMYIILSCKNKKDTEKINRILSSKRPKGGIENEGSHTKRQP